MKKMQMNKAENTVAANINTSPKADDSDNLSLLADLYLKEYESTRQQIEMSIGLAEKSINYLLLLIAALLSASQIFVQTSSGIEIWLKNNPYMYLVLAILFLWFPMEDLSRNLHIATLGGYEKNVLSPKLNMLINLLLKSNNVAKEYLSWETHNFQKKLTGVFRWEEYRVLSQYRSTVPLYGIFAILRYFVINLPVLFFLRAFFITRNMGSPFLGWSLGEYILGASFLIAISTMLIGSFVAVKKFTA